MLRDRLPSRSEARPDATGFTLIELMISLAILAVLATTLLPLAELQSRRYKERQLEQALQTLRQAIDAYKQAGDEGRIPRKIDESGYPHDLNELAEGVLDTKSPTTQKIYFLRRIPRDPMNPDKTLTPAQTWGLRSYASPPDQPQAGKDVFDVYSQSEGVGLNNQPYREW